MIPLERQRRILRRVEERHTMAINDLVEELDVSHMTIRRDIRQLEEAGRVVSVPGGVSLPQRLSLDDSHVAKESLRREEKLAIAHIAAARVSPGDVLYLDAGTTTLAIAGQLASIEGLTIITNDLAIATLLSEQSQAELFFAGGALDKTNLSAEGGLAARAIAGFNIDAAFMSTSSFDLRGITVPSDAKLSVKRAVLGAASRTYLVSDSSKYGRVASLRAIALGDFVEIITDSDLPVTAADQIRTLGATLTLAPKH